MLCAQEVAEHGTSKRSGDCLTRAIHESGNDLNDEELRDNLITLMFQARRHRTGAHVPPVPRRAAPGGMTPCNATRKRHYANGGFICLSAAGVGQACRRGRASLWRAGRPTAEQALQCVYAERVFREGMRYYSPVPVFGRHALKARHRLVLRAFS